MLYTLGLSPTPLEVDFFYEFFDISYGPDVIAVPNGVFQDTNDFLLGIVPINVYGGDIQ